MTKTEGAIQRVHLIVSTGEEFRFDQFGPNQNIKY
jgi:hypothetical protein